MHAVCMGVTTPRYNEAPPFHPDRHYPELPFAEVSSTPNPPYDLLRNLLRRMGFDAARYGELDWNPLSSLIEPGNCVVIKPNFVLDRHAAGGDVFSIITHPSILRAVVDYAYIALQGAGRIVIADAPQMDCRWDRLMAIQQLHAISEFYKFRFGFNVEVYDLRNFELVDPDQPAYSDNRRRLAGDPAGSVIVNLGDRSAFAGLPSENYYGADYDRSETIRRHRGIHHEYSVSKTVLSADVLISVPKMKVHKKVGVTLNLKGLVGINTDKNFLIHYRVGTPRGGGDQLPDARAPFDYGLIRIQRWLFDKFLARQNKAGDAVYRLARGLYRAFVKKIRPVSSSVVVQDYGNWHGNDSAWRMTVDLAKILFYADARGTLRDTVQRRMFCVVDGIVGGEGEGPLVPDAKPCGCLMAGKNPYAVDMVAARMMGFDVGKIRQFDILKDKKWDFGLSGPEDIEILRDNRNVPGRELFDRSNRDRHFDFRPHPGWVGHLEVGSHA